MTLSLEITTKLGCANGCHFCPQDKLSKAYKSPYRMMRLDRFQAILDKLPSEVRVDFSGYVEPYFNPVCGKMIEAAIKSGRTVYIYTTLMGMTPDDFSALRQTPPSFIKIHAPDRTGLKLDSDVWLKQFTQFLECGLPYEIMAMGELEDPVKQFMDLRGITVELPAMISRGGNLWKPQKIEGPLVCGENRWHQNVVLPDGSVYGCCMDYGLSLPLGNILTDSYETIFQRAEEYRLNTNPPDDSICRTCEWAKPILPE